MHLSEAPYERDVARQEHGSSSVQYLARIGVLGPDLLGAHCVWLDQADIQTAARFGVGCSYNPSSNMKSAAGLMPAPEMLAADLDSEVQACIMGARRMAELFERFGRDTVGLVSADVEPSAGGTAVAALVGGDAVDGSAGADGGAAGFQREGLRWAAIAGQDAKLGIDGRRRT